MSSEFDLFDQFVLDTKYVADYVEKSTECVPLLLSKPISLRMSSCTSCIHNNCGENSGILSCLDCGEEVGKNITQDKEWRFYGHSDTKYKNDPSRCQMRKIDDKSILRDLEGLGFSDRIVNTANNIYTQVTSKEIKRGNSRKSIIFACIFYAYSQCGNPQSSTSLIEVFGLNKKHGLFGLKYVKLNMNKELSPAKNIHITPVNLIEEIMNKFSATEQQKKDVVSIYTIIKNKSTKINRSRPQSIAAGITYYWICQNNKQITITEFVSKVGLSALTVSRIAKEVDEIISAEKI